MDLRRPVSNRVEGLAPQASCLAHSAAGHDFCAVTTANGHNYSFGAGKVVSALHCAVSGFGGVSFRIQG